MGTPWKALSYWHDDLMDSLEKVPVSVIPFPQTWHTNILTPHWIHVPYANTK